MRRLFLLLIISAFAAPSAFAQTTDKDFDYLLGDWRYDATSQEYGKYSGLWSAVRIAGGQVLDEFHVLGNNDSTVYLTTTLRNYNSRLKRWELIGTDDGNGLQDFGSAQKVGEEMHIEQRFGVGRGTPSLWRIRYYNIQPDRFSWAADMSKDDGKTWVKDWLTIEARRIGPARSLPALTRAAR